MLIKCDINLIKEFTVKIKGYEELSSISLLVTGDLTWVITGGVHVNRLEANLCPLSQKKQRGISLLVGWLDLNILGCKIQTTIKELTPN